MQKKNLFLILGISLVLGIFTSHIASPLREDSQGKYALDSQKKLPNEDALQQKPADKEKSAALSWGMKAIPEDITEKDLDLLEALGIAILSGEWGMDAMDPHDMKNFLDRVGSRGMKYILNFSDEAGWGYLGDGSDSNDQKPKWQSARIREYLKELGSHPAIYGYDISNEAGENLPNGGSFPITLREMREAAADIRSIDKTRQIIIRMHYWDEEDQDFGPGNPFSPGIADIVMLNLYSNFSRDRANPLIPNMIKDSAHLLINKIRAVDPGVKIWISLAAFREFPDFPAPTSEDLARDIRQTLAIEGIENIGFFGWQETYPNEPPSWYLPNDGKELIETIRAFTL